MFSSTLKNNKIHVWNQKTCLKSEIIFLRKGRFLKQGKEKKNDQSDHCYFQF